MPSAFDAYFAASAAPVFMDQFGEAVIYTPTGGTAFNATGIWLPQSFLDVSPDEHGRMAKADGKLTMQKSTFTTEDVTPRESDSVRVAGRTFSVVSIEDEGGTFYSFTLSSSKFTERSDGGIRRGGR